MADDAPRAVLLCGHGSREPATQTEFTAFVGALARRFKRSAAPRLVQGGYLEFAEPTIAQALERLYGAGARRIDALPAMLYAARHVQSDVPKTLREFAADHRGMTVRFGREFGLADGILDAAAERIAAAASPGDSATARRNSLLVVVGRGTRDEAANATVTSLAERLRDRLGFGQALAGFAGATAPDADAVLAQAAASGCRRVVVFPFFLFTGVLVRRVQGAVAAAAAAHPAIAFATADYLKDHPRVIDALIERLSELDAVP